MKTYEERLQEYAQKHADKWNSGIAKDNTDCWKFNEMMDEAEVTIAAVAEEVAANLRLTTAWPESDIKQHLIENGYVPKP